VKDPQLAGFYLQAGVLALCLWIESLAPLFMDRSPTQRLRHGVRNLGLGLANGAVLTFLVWQWIALASRWSQTQRFGLLNELDLTAGTRAVAGFFLFDLWMYLWHRANHGVPFLWRFHRVHHTDPALDSTSAYRFHIGEMVLSAVTRLAVVPVLGIRIQDLVLYELVLSPVIIFHHSNIALPEWLDRKLRSLIVTPGMHRVHHSDIPHETNSNYASVFSFWDRACRTYCRRDNIRLHYGLKEFPALRWDTLRGMLLQPLASSRRV